MFTAKGFEGEVLVVGVKVEFEAEKNIVMELYHLHDGEELLFHCCVVLLGCVELPQVESNRPVVWYITLPS
eukprot:8485166-Ditylum_brightwellii.AAC.1